MKHASEMSTAAAMGAFAFNGGAILDYKAERRDGQLARQGHDRDRAGRRDGPAVSPPSIA